MVFQLGHFLLNLWGKSMLQLFKSKMTETGYLLASLKYGKCYLIFKKINTQKVFGKFPLSGDPSTELVIRLTVFNLLAVQHYQKLTSQQNILKSPAQ